MKTLLNIINEQDNSQFKNEYNYPTLQFNKWLGDMKRNGAKIKRNNATIEIYIDNNLVATYDNKQHILHCDDLKMFDKK